MKNEENLDETVDLRNLTEGEKRDIELLNKSRNPDGSFNSEKHKALIRGLYKNKEENLDETVDIKNLTEADKKEQERLRKSRNPDGTFNSKKYEEAIKERLNEKSD